MGCDVDTAGTDARRPCARPCSAAGLSGGAEVGRISGSRLRRRRPGGAALEARHRNRVGVSGGCGWSGVQLPDATALDGELVVRDAAGRLAFEWLQNRLATRCRGGPGSRGVAGPRRRVRSAAAVRDGHGLLAVSEAQGRARVRVRRPPAVGAVGAVPVDHRGRHPRPRPWPPMAPSSSWPPLPRAPSDVWPRAAALGPAPATSLVRTRSGQGPCPDLPRTLSCDCQDDGRVVRGEGGDGKGVEDLVEAEPGR